MKSTSIKKDGGVSTVFIEPFGYYETATWDKKERKWVVKEEHRTESREEAMANHDKLVPLQTKDK